MNKNGEVTPNVIITRSVRYDKRLYDWLLLRSKRYGRSSIQRENTYLLELLRSRPDVLRLLDGLPTDTGE